MQAITDPAVTHQIETAMPALDEERERLDIERAAFTQFRKRVAAMDVHTPAANMAVGIKNTIMGASTASASSTQLEQVRDAYRETVMSVPHYDEDYDHSLNNDITEEFSPELASALAAADSLTPPIQETLLTGCQQATEGRTTLLSALDREADSLQYARDTLEALQTTLDEMNQQPIAVWSTNDIIATYERLADLETQCDELAAERQAELHSQRIPGPSPADEELNEYFYESLSVTYPVLADLAEFDSLLHTARQHLEQALVSR